MFILSQILSGLKWLGRLFKSPAVLNAFKQVDALIPMIAPVVQDIRKLVPSASNASYQDIVNAYIHFGQSWEAIRRDPATFGSSLKDLALAIIRGRVSSSYPERLLNLAIEAALVALKAK